MAAETVFHNKDHSRLGTRFLMFFTYPVCFLWLFFDVTFLLYALGVYRLPIALVTISFDNELQSLGNIAVILRAVSALLIVMYHIGNARGRFYPWVLLLILLSVYYISNLIYLVLDNATGYAPVPFLIGLLLTTLVFVLCLVYFIKRKEVYKCDKSNDGAYQSR